MSYYSKQTLSFDFSNPFLDPLPKLVPKNKALSAKVVGWTPTINGGCGISPAKTTMEKQHFLCMDVDYEGQAEVIKEGESRKGILTFVNADKFRFVEQEVNKPAAPKAPTKRRDLQWHPLAGSLHGKVSVNANGAMLMLYIRHEDCNTNSNQLADIIVSEAEQIGEALADINLEEEVAKCGK